MRDSRQDAAMARLIDAALVVQKLRGTEEAIDYLRSAHACEELIARVLSPGGARSSMTAAPYRLPAAVNGPDGTDRTDEANETGEPGEPQVPAGPGTCFYRIAGRRHDVMRAAVVQAAIGLAAQFDAARAERLLRREGLSDETIARVLAGDDGRRRTRQVAVR